jgi:hypothetical protein
VKVGAAAVAGVAETDPVAGGELDGRLAGEALHRPRLADGDGACQAPRAPVACDAMERTHRRRERVRQRLAGALALSVLFPLAGPAIAQGPGPDLNELVLGWARGRYASPLFCEIGGRPVRGLRRLLVTPGPSHVRPPVDLLVFVSLDVEEASRCFTALESEVPDLRGRVQIRLRGNAAPDIATREFNSLVRRKGGFEFDIPSGSLLVSPVGEAAGAPRRLDLRGGRARMTEVKPGTDAYRMLADLPTDRLLLLELETRDGERLELPLVRTDDR